MTTRDRVLAALDAVYDPELDEPITTLGFVGACDVSQHGDVAVRLRLPTSQCAPNFAWLMVAEARERLGDLPGVGAVSVVLVDHMTQDEINGAATFDAAFPGETAGDVQALRVLFWRKALLARQGRVCAALRAAGATPEAVVAMAVSDLPDGPQTRRCLQLRRELGLRADPDAPALVAGDGAPIPPAELDRWQRRARLVGVSLESNGGLCRSLLRSRYPDHEEVAA